MKQLSIIWVVIALCMAIASCSSDPENEPKNPDNPENPSNPEENTTYNDYRGDWIVVFHEMSIQNNDWTKQENKSEECNQWKWEHRDFLVMSTQNGDRKDWEWHITFKNYMKSDVEKEVKRFVKWTLDSQEPTPIGLDIYTATVQERQAPSGYSYSYSLKDEQPNNPNRWLIRYTESRYEKYDEQLEISPDYYTWVSKHEQHQTSHTQSNGSYGVYSNTVWEIESPSINITDAVVSIDIFKSWSIKKTYSDEDAYLTLGGMILDRKSGVSTSY